MHSLRWLRDRHGPTLPVGFAALLFLLAVGCSNEAPEEAGAAEAAFVDAAEISVGYAGDEACASCHEDLYASYHRTGMGRSVSHFDPATAPERFDAEGRSPVIYNERFDYYYQAFVRGDTLFQREFRLGEDGAVAHERTHHADYVVGSGNATRSYFMRENGFVTEMPLTWYVERARWDLSPGYETSNSRFSRPANLECMTCHNGLPDQSPFTQNHYAELPLGITCERCHGPAAEHVEAQLAGGSAETGLVDLATLDRDLQLGVCQQCHLEGLAVFKDGEDPTTYRPGEPLASHRTVFARQEQVEDEEAFGIASHALRLALSACFEESAMTCTTCHDPHQPTAELGPDQFNAVCQSCHGGESDADAFADGSSPHEDVCSRPGTATVAESMTGDCVSCHMQTGGVSDIPHVSFTDHWIRRELPPARPAGRIERDQERTEPIVLVNLLDGAAPLAPGEAELETALAYFHLYETMHQSPAYLPDIAARVRRGLAAGADRADARIALGRSLMLMDSLAAAERVLGEAAQRYPGDAYAQYWFGAVRNERGKPAAALSPLGRAIEIQPLLVEARIEMAEALSALRRMDEAVAYLKTAVETDPLHHPAAWNNLGFLHLQAGRTAEAEPALAEAVALDPDFAEARVNLGSVFLMTERIEAAAEQFEEALRARPDYAPAVGNLGVAYVQLGRPDDARRQFERLLELSPGDARARAYLAELGA